MASEDRNIGLEHHEVVASNYHVEITQLELPVGCIDQV